MSQPLTSQDLLLAVAKQARDFLKTRHGDISLAAGSDAAFLYRALRDAITKIEKERPIKRDPREGQIKPCPRCGKPTEVIIVDGVEAPCGPCVVDIVCP